MLRHTLALIVLVPAAVCGQALLTCPAPAVHWSDYYAALAFSETRFDDIRGTHRMTVAEAAERNHFRFDYDRDRRLVRVTFALGDTPRSVNDHSRTFFAETAVVTICYRDGMEVRHFLDDRGNPALTRATSPRNAMGSIVSVTAPCSPFTMPPASPFRTAGARPGSRGSGSGMAP